MEFKVYCRYEDYAKQLNIYIFRINPDGSESICTKIGNKNLTFKTYTIGEIVEPTISLTGYVATPFLQGIVDAAKKIGITPKGEPILENEMAAIKYHLEDMRSLVFRTKQSQ
jgi:hypothetical protein